MRGAPQACRDTAQCPLHEPGPAGSCTSSPGVPALLPAHGIDQVKDDALRTWQGTQLAELLSTQTMTNVVTLVYTTSCASCLSAAQSHCQGLASTIRKHLPLPHRRPDPMWQHGSLAHKEWLAGARWPLRVLPLGCRVESHHSSRQGCNGRGHRLWHELHERPGRGRRAAG